MEKKIIKNSYKRMEDYLISVERSHNYCDKIVKNSVEFTINFKQTRNFPEVLDWLKKNVRNISFAKNRRYGTSWWLFRLNGHEFHTIGFKNPQHAMMFKLSGLYSNTEFGTVYE